jgi:hypothetical protein
MEFDRDDVEGLEPREDSIDRRPTVAADVHPTAIDVHNHAMPLPLPEWLECDRLSEPPGVEINDIAVRAPVVCMPHPNGPDTTIAAARKQVAHPSAALPTTEGPHIGRRPPMLNGIGLPYLEIV